MSFCAAAVIVANLTSYQVVPAFNGQPGSAEAVFDFYTLTNSSSYVEFGFKDLGNVSGNRWSLDRNQWLTDFEEPIKILILI